MSDLTKMSDAETAEGLATITARADLPPSAREWLHEAARRLTAAAERVREVEAKYREAMREQMEDGRKLHAARERVEAEKERVDRAVRDAVDTRHKLAVMASDRDAARAEVESLKAQLADEVEAKHQARTLLEALKSHAQVDMLTAALSPAPAVGGLMLPDLWTVVDGGGTRVGCIHGSEPKAARQLAAIEGTPGSIHGPYRVVMIPAHQAPIAPTPAPGGAE